MTSTSLASFPNEILRQIFSTFCLHCLAKQHFTAPDAYFCSTTFPQQDDKPSWYSLNCQALFSLCLVSSRFCNIAQPILYHEFMPGYANSWRSTVYTWEGRLTSFMRTMIERQDLALLVKRIYIHPYLLNPVTLDEAQDILQQAADTLGIQSWQQLSAADLVGILIAESPNLEHLSLQIRNSVNMSWSGLHAANVSRLPLKTVDICPRVAVSQSPDGMFNLAWHAGGLFELARSLETLNLHMCISLRFQTSTISLPHIKFLRITCSRLHNIEEVLSSCSNLQTFVYEATSPAMMLCNPSLPDGSDHFQFSDIVRYLRPHQQTLTRLHMDLRERGWSDATDIEKSAPTISLKAFSKLEHLLLNSDEIYNGYQHWTTLDGQLLVKLLPVSIISVHLTHHGWAALAHAGPTIGRTLARFARGLIILAKAIARGRFPKLKQVRCDVEDQEKLEEYGVADEFASRNIDFGYICFPHSKGAIEGSDIPPPGTPPLMPLDWSSDSDL